MTISEAIEKYHSKYYEELHKTGIFYSFTQEQFEENKIPKSAPIEEFISCGNGMYIHKSNEHKLNEFYKTKDKELRKEFLKSIPQEELIYYELLNHECFYTEEPLEILDIIKCYYSEEPEENLVNKIKEIYSKHRKEETT